MPPSIIRFLSHHACRRDEALRSESTHRLHCQIRSRDPALVAASALVALVEYSHTTQKRHRRPQTLNTAHCKRRTLSCGHCVCFARRIPHAVVPATLRQPPTSTPEGAPATDITHIPGQSAATPVDLRTANRPFDRIDSDSRLWSFGSSGYSGCLLPSGDSGCLSPSGDSGYSSRNFSARFNMCRLLATLDEPRLRATSYISRLRATLYVPRLRATLDAILALPLSLGFVPTAPVPDGTHIYIFGYVSTHVNLNICQLS